MVYQKTGVELISDERKRQINKEGWTAEHDQAYNFEELALAGSVYATPERFRNYGPDQLPTDWPWDPQWWKPCPDDRIRELVKAGALIAAQIDLEISRKKEVPLL